jgi:hypothetical protein
LLVVERSAINRTKAKISIERFLAGIAPFHMDLRFLQSVGGETRGDVRLTSATRRTTLALLRLRIRLKNVSNAYYREGEKRYGPGRLKSMKDHEHGLGLIRDGFAKKRH